jgi:hypothetical protein
MLAETRVFFFLALQYKEIHKKNENDVVKICHVYNSTYLKYIFLFLYSKHQTLNDITNKIHV